MKSFILGVKEARGTKGGSSKCPSGVFKSKVRDAVVPLCEAHYPQENAKNAWIIIFYEANSPQTDFRDAANEAAVVLGSEPPDKSKALKQEPVKRRDRIISLGQKYQLEMELPPKGPFGTDPLAKIGSICCDCSNEMQKFCSQSLGDHREETLPLKAWVEKGVTKVYDGDGMDTPALVEFALQRLGVMNVVEVKEEL